MPRLRAETPACTKRFGEGRHFGPPAKELVRRTGVQARPREGEVVVEEEQDVSLGLGEKARLV